jgi:SSS family transporter
MPSAIIDAVTINPALSPVDVAVLALYMAGTISLGGWLSRRQRTLGAYFVGDRDVSWWLVLVSIVATETSTVTFLSIPGLAFNRNGGNLTFLQLPLGYMVGRIVIAGLLLPQYLRGELLSAYQLLHQRFDKTVQRTASALFLLTRALADGLRLYLAALLLQIATGWDDRAAVLVIAAATMAYTYLGGMEAVIWTDLIQFALYLLGAVVAGICIVHNTSGGIEQGIAIAEEAGKFVWLDTSADLTRPYTLWAGLIGGAFLTMASHGADHMMVQRYFCSRSLTQARLALVLSGAVVLLQFLLFLLLGVGLYVLYEQGVLRPPESAKNDEVFGFFIVHFLPHGLVGLVTAGVLAAAMSTLSSSLNSSAGAFVADFYRPLRPARTEAHYLAVSRGMTLVWGAARVVVALAALRLAGERSVIDQVLKVAGFTTGAVLGLFLLGSLRRPVRSLSALAGLAAGLGAVFAVWLPSLSEGPALAWPWYAPVGTATTVGVALVLNLLDPTHGSLADRGSQPGIRKPG